MMLADRLESIREQGKKILLCTLTFSTALLILLFNQISVEGRPHSGAFRRPVSRRAYPNYYELISDPIDLQTIRDKNKRYESVTLFRVIHS